MLINQFEIDWKSQRQKESRGFVSKRILFTLIVHQRLCFGTAIVQTFSKKITRIVNLSDVFSVIEIKGYVKRCGYENPSV